MPARNTPHIEHKIKSPHGREKNYYYFHFISKGNGRVNISEQARKNERERGKTATRKQ
jgi:hypothetical protein